MLLKIYEENPNEREIRMVCECLSDGGIIIFPTDTLYAIGCDLKKQKSAEKVARLKQTQLEKANFSIICADLSTISNYTPPIHNSIFRIMKQCLPGPYTFIMPANSNVPKIFQHKKKTIGIRVPDNRICKTLVTELGNPLIVASVPEDEYVENYTDPEIIYDIYKNDVDIVIDGGYGGIEPSTIANCSSGDIEILRLGKGKEIEEYL